jgi:hypothetical protein
MRLPPSVTRIVSAVLALGAPALGARAGGDAQVAGPATRDGVLVYTVASDLQKDPCSVQVLLPDRLEQQKRYPVLYVLPVAPGTSGPWGSGIREARRTGVHNRFGLICAAPSFSNWPWYADHPTDTALQQERYLLEIVVPLVEGRHPALRRPEGRLLVGFSKSGWGAWSLLLRHPEVFGRAAAWDAPLLEETPKRFGMHTIFGSQENLERYRITRLLEQRAALLRSGPPRLVLTGHGNFGADVRRVHEKMMAWGIPHRYDNGTARKHDWHSGWFAETVGYLMASAGEGRP